MRSTDGRAIPIQVDGDHIADELEARFSVVAGRAARRRVATTTGQVAPPRTSRSVGLRLTPPSGPCPLLASTDY